MIFDRWLGAGPAKTAARSLHDAAAAQGRAPELYASLGAPDTVEGRFELLTAHVILLVDRLRNHGAAAAAVSQALFDVYVRDLDGALREMGVGDLTVPKRMRKLAQAFYGRAAAYGAAFDGPQGELEAVVARTILQSAEGADPAPLAQYIRTARAALAASDINVLIGGHCAWPAP
jgi:cytochrome b pre-mRNA-processing protein 3